jgi:hypothetical protein
MKIAELLQSYDEIAKTRTYNKAVKIAAEKIAFVPNPNIPPPQPGQPVQQALPQGQQDPQQQAAMQQQAAPQPDPSQGQPPQQPPQQAAPAQAPQQPQADANGNGTLMDEVMNALQQLPPQVQQQIAPIIQNLQAMPPEQREQELAQILEQVASEAGTGAPATQQQGMEAQASEEEAKQAEMDPAMMQQMMAAQPAQDSQQQAADDAAQAENSAIEAKNELDNVRVTLSVRELLDLVGKGSATASLLKVKQLADTHQQKMDQTRQKAEADQQKAQADQQQQQQGIMGSGGIYANPMDGGAPQ